MVRRPIPATVLFPQTRNFTPRCFSPLRCINVYKCVQMCINVYKCVPVNCRVTSDKKLYPTLFLSTQVCNCVLVTYCRGGNPAMNQHPIQGGEVAMLSIASCCRKRDQLWPPWPPWLVCDFIYTSKISH